MTIKRLNLQDDAISVIITLDEDGMPEIDTYVNFSDALPDEEKLYLRLMLKGLEFTAFTGSTYMASLGNAIGLLESYEENDVEFEPDEDLIKKLKEKFSPFDKNKLN